MNQASKPTHPGQFVRDLVLKPRKLKVAEAAELVGVGRQAFSAFLNGRAATTAEMAAKLEVTFEVDAQELLRMQAEFDTFEAKAAGVSGEARRHVVPLLAAKARDIEDWIERNIGGRTRLSVLLRILVNSTTAALTRVDFPGNDDAERPGWDGWSECETPNPWVPAGMAGWEFGTNADVKGKADGDFAKSVKALPASERKSITFIFVTPRHWPGKEAWVKAMAAKKQWRDVRAYDSSDLEQWLDQSVPGQAWFAAERNDVSIGTQSLDKCWDDWMGASHEKLPKQLFNVAVEAAKKTFTAWVGSKPTRPLVIAADSTEEALAFVSVVFADETSVELGRLRDRCVVFMRPGALSKVASGVKDFMAVVPNHDVERELGPHGSTIRSIVITPRNTAGGSQDVVLEPLTSEAFTKAFEGCEWASRDEVDRLARASGRSLTVLRRRLSLVRAIQTPHWAEDKDLASSLVPFLFAGAWNSENIADREALCRMAGIDSYEVLEQRAQDVVSMHDAPMWSVGAFRGVVSKMDMLFSIAGSLTKPALERFFLVARHILGEDDPRLDLPEEDRWAAAIHNKRRTYSESLRDGVAETVVLLAVHGEELLEQRTGFSCADAAAMLVRGVLTPLTTRKLEANQGDLPAYAEAAPEEFLDILEADLRAENPESFGLLRNTDTLFGGCPRSGLLWALENLAWNPKTLRRVVMILGRLATVEITDNWTNKPISSLYAILSAWMPQTAADHETRVRVLQLLADKFPGVAWKVCMKVTDGTDDIGHYSHKPRWRNDGHGHGEPFKYLGPVNEFRRAAAEILLGWKHPCSVEMISDLVGAIHNYDDTYRDRIWAVIGEWANGAAEGDKAAVREKVRVSMLSKRAARRATNTNWAALSATARAVYKALEPADSVFRHQWLFLDHWVAESADEIHGDLDFQGREERVLRLRVAALVEVWRDKGLQGLCQIAAGGNAAHTVGSIAARHVLDKRMVTELLVGIMRDATPDLNLLAGALSSLSADDREDVLTSIRAQLPSDIYVVAPTNAPFDARTWKLVDALGAEEQRRYWRNVRPWRAVDEDLAEAVERLLAADRPLAAFYISKYDSKHLGPDLIYRLLLAIAQGGSEEPGSYQLEQHSVREAFTVVDASASLGLEQKAGLEFAYVDVLVSRFGREKKKSGISNLEQYVEQRPDFYVQALAWAYKRKDRKEDPPELIAPPERKKAFAERAYKMLEGLSRLPGYGLGTELRHDLLLDWVHKVRTLAGEIGRLDVADICIGRLLSTAPDGADGVWPCEPVRQVMEDIQSKGITHGASIGRFNSRGAVWRGRGGDQERDLASHYREAAGALEFSHPFVATTLLADLAREYERMAKREDMEDLVVDRLR